MSRTAVIIISMLVLGATAASAGTFVPAPYLAEEGVQVLSKQVANDLVDRDLFGDPYATVVVGNIDVYEGFPYVEARYFQIVSDPAWDRLVYGEMGQGMDAFDGASSSFGALDSPRGMSTDGEGRVFVADTGNNRVLAFQVSSEFDEMRLEPLFAVDGLQRPYDVAFSDAGTPADLSDDRLYVANSGRNEVLSYRLNENSADFSARVGKLGSGDHHFAGPMALVVGREDGAHTSDIYVSDAHNRRIVHLVDNGSALVWSRSLPHGLDLVTSLDTDHWGNVYAAAPHQGSVEKYTPELLPVASLSANVDRPRSFHVPMVRVHDHRNGEIRRAGQGSGILVEEWDAKGGIRLMELGVELKDAAVVPADELQVQFTVTDRARVSAEVVDPSDGTVIARHEAGFVDAGARTINFADADYLTAYDAGDYEVRLVADSSYDERQGAEMQVSFAMNQGGGSALPARVQLLGNAPNPFNPATTINFVVPNGAAQPYRLDIFDARGRLVRQLASGSITAGPQAIRWDGRDDTGAAVGSGLYLYRLNVGDVELSDKMVLLK